MWTLIKISWRSIWRSKRRTAITVAAIALSLGLAVFSVSFAEGVYAQMIEDAVRMQAGHVTLEHPEYADAPAIDLVLRHSEALRERLQAIEGVEGTKVQILGQGVARSGGGAGGVSILGVEPESEAKTSSLARRIIEGTYLEAGDERHVVVGRTLAERLKVTIGKKLVLSSNDANGDLVEELVRVKGIFATGAPEIDGYLVQVPVRFARRLYGWKEGEVTRIGLVLADPDRRARIMAAARAMVDKNEVAIRTWEEVMPELATYVKLDGGGNYVFMGILIGLSLFTIFNTILMSVLERTREFAVMLALGTHPWRLRAQVLMESAMMAVVGVSAGLLWGGLLAYWLEVEGMDPKELYGEGMTVGGVALDTRIYADVTPGILFWLGLLVFVAIMLTSLLTMRRAAQIPVADVLR